MFDIGWGELVVIGVVALIAIGPKELPGVLRSVGQWTGKIRRMASEFQGQFQEAMREAEMADVKKQVDQLTSTVSEYTQLDPLAQARKEVDDAFKDVSLDSAPTEKPADAAAADTPAPIAAGISEPVSAPEPAPAAAPASEPAPAAPVPPDGGGGRAA